MNHKNRVKKDTKSPSSAHQEEKALELLQQLLHRNVATTLAPLPSPIGGGLPIGKKDLQDQSLGGGGEDKGTPMSMGHLRDYKVLLHQSVTLLHLCKDALDDKDWELKALKVELQSRQLQLGEWRAAMDALAGHLRVCVDRVQAKQSEIDVWKTLLASGLESLQTRRAEVEGGVITAKKQDEDEVRETQTVGKSLGITNRRRSMMREVSERYVINIQFLISLQKKNIIY
eukprot:GHVR01018535.1.p1 GENE.GHVR01018535.1~~GHVR01018535.1.p1  ORF type:complete len:229 (+),score=40.14 GHVR01018535.1:733-1419(+)